MQDSQRALVRPVGAATAGSTPGVAQAMPGALARPGVMAIQVQTKQVVGVKRLEALPQWAVPAAHRPVSRPQGVPRVEPVRRTLELLQVPPHPAPPRRTQPGTGELQQLRTPVRPLLRALGAQGPPHRPPTTPAPVRPRLQLPLLPQRQQVPRHLVVAENVEVKVAEEAEAGVAIGERGYAPRN